ncbi:hypothetical protein G3T14_21960 [Methylobacterium sp. BTF04]|uniref:hypothetical protein n=1 Tax=Methylobacterium sp. BTF04 TaxID=2708300 RepID=UPI0013D6C400|nr:hypothetical protein [Methylobacterium sp. BTF04]NEU14747.1 hypothetical protein [Methylobacterium sp. BTF04]
MAQDFTGKFVVVNKEYVPDFELTREQALKLSAYGPVSVENGFGGGTSRACWSNSANLCLNHPRFMYCVGFACGGDNIYQAHAWVKNGSDYAEASPQIGKLREYILCFEMTNTEMQDLVRKNSKSNKTPPPVLNNEGKLVILDL